MWTFIYRAIGEKNTLVEQKLRHHLQAVAKSTPNETINETATPNETINETEKEKLNNVV